MLEKKEERKRFDEERIKLAKVEAEERRNEFFNFRVEDININFKTNQDFMLLEDEEVLV